MSKKDDAPFGIGGCYEVGRDGVRRLVSPGTAEAPYGGGPRDADGKPVDAEHRTPDQGKPAPAAKTPTSGEL
jgi:hypothetical protein